MRHDPAWLRLHDGHAHGVLADDPVHAHSGSEPSAGHTDQQNHHRPHSDAAQSHVDPARTDTSGSASLTRPNHPKAALPIDQRVGPAGSCTGGFRTQAPETLHNSRRSDTMTGCPPPLEPAIRIADSCRAATRPIRANGARSCLPEICYWFRPQLRGENIDALIPHRCLRSSFRMSIA
jgi:hypothetical protein